MTGSAAVNGKVDRHISELAQGDHTCLIYRDASEQMASAVPFVKAGLRRGERCVYISDDRTTGEVTAALHAAGVDIDLERRRSALLFFTKRDAYLRSGTFDPASMIAFLMQATEQALADGFHGLCATGEMTWALGPEPGCERLIEYEALLNEFFPGSRALALCQYNQSRSSPALIRDVLRTHPTVVVESRVYRDNPYYESPDLLLGRIPDTLRTEWMLSQLKRIQDTYETLAQTEEQFRQAQKMEAVGRLAGGVAHDFNNLLTAILGYADLLLTDLPVGGQHRADLCEIHRAAMSAAALTGQLLAFSRRQILQPVTLDLNAVIRSMEPMLRRLIGEDVSVVLKVASNLTPIHADPSQLEQVVMNLAVNARDAMPQGGTLTITTANVELDEAFARTRPGARPGLSVRLGIADTGQGMTPEVQAHLFEPFFTTKERGQGTGLGLSMVYGIVKQSGGFIWVESAPGQGTTLTIDWPPAKEKLEPAAPARAEVGTLTGTETILLVEDDDRVRELARRSLERYGYKVLVARGAGEAVDLCGQYRDQIALLLTDVVMPGASGTVLAEHVGQHCPCAKVLYTSGYTDNAIVHHGVLKPGTPFLPKPFTPEVLAKAVRQMLDR
ncbi:MAG: MEDS domain-containing protein [Actinobacteria bacterium]|nr:MEDS domain-containing protein [Actinomycetota bacterium]